MKLAASLAGLLLLAFTPEMHSAAKNCVPDTGCPKDEGPPKCCQPPPCEFWDALLQARARERIIESQGMPDPGQENETARRRFTDKVDQAFSRIREKQPKCPGNSSLGKVPQFRVDPDDPACTVATRVGKSWKQIALGEVLASKTTTACEEVVGARYNSTTLSEARCAAKSADAYHLVLDRYEQARRERVNLEDHLVHYFRVCTIVEDPEIDLLVAENSVRKLKEMVAKKNWPKKTARRSRT